MTVTTTPKKSVIVANILNSIRVLYDLAQNNWRDAESCKYAGDMKGCRYHQGRYDAYMNARAELQSVLEISED